MHIEEIDLTDCGLNIPADRIGVVLSQPYIDGESFAENEPFRCAPAFVDTRMAALSRALDVSLTNRHGLAKTHFTVLPEYSIPGVDGIGLVTQRLNAAEWPAGSIAIGGTDGLTVQQYAELIGTEDVHAIPLSTPERIGTRWVNCGIVWVKGSDGRVQRWVQPKLRPARLEADLQHESMYQGEGVFLFKGTQAGGANFRFLVLICYDWIALQGDPVTQILTELNTMAGGGTLALNWVFVIQHNPQPNHETFLGRVPWFFNQLNFPNVARDRTTLIFANTAGRDRPGIANHYGASSIVSSPSSLFASATCHQSFTSRSRRARNESTQLRDCKDAVFRERGACIHSFVMVNQASMVGGGGGHRYSIETASISPFTIGQDEPRAPDRPVAAVTKWVNDSLDELKCLSATLPNPGLATGLVSARDAVAAVYRRVEPQRLTRSLVLATQGADADVDADHYALDHEQALAQLMYSSNLARLTFDAGLTVRGAPAHAAISVDGKDLEFASVRGDTHENCVEHFRTTIGTIRVETILVTQDRFNTRWFPEDGSFLENTKAPDSGEPKITAPRSGLRRIAFQNLLEMYRQAQNVDGLRTSIRDHLEI